MSIILRLRGFGVRIGTQTILRGLDLDVPDRGVTMLMGPGGAGKSTLMRTITGLNNSIDHMVVSGEVSYQGQPVAPPLGHDGWARLVVQHPRDIMNNTLDYLFEHSPRRGDMTRGEKRQEAAAMMEAAGVAWGDALWDKTLVYLSLPQRRVLSIMRELQLDPPLLCVDEPTAGLDEDAVEPIVHFLREQARHRALLMVTHHQARARGLGDHFALLAGGRIHEYGDAARFFDNPTSAAGRQFVRTGGCDVPSPDARLEELDPSWLARLGPGAAAAAESFDQYVPGVDSFDEEVPEDEVDEGFEVEIAQEVADLEEAMVMATEESPDTVDEVVIDNLGEPAARTPRRSVPNAARGPRGFRWVDPGALAGTPGPGVIRDIKEDLRALARMGITTLVTMRTTPIPGGATEQFGIDNIYFPVRDMHAPEMAPTLELCQRLERHIHEGGVVAVHCKAGLGRTGTLLAAVLILRGLDARSAIDQVRAVEPRYIQAERQEDFLFAFADYVQTSSLERSLDPSSGLSP